MGFIKNVFPTLERKNIMSEVKMNTVRYTPEQAEKIDKPVGEHHIPKVAICTLTNKGSIPLTNNFLASLIKANMMSKHFVHIFCTDDYSYNYYFKKNYKNAIRTKFAECEEKYSTFSSLNFRNITRNKLPAIREILLGGTHVIYMDSDIYVNKSFYVDILNIWYGNNEDESTHSLLLQEDIPKSPYSTGVICITPEKENIELLDKAIKTNNKEIKAGNLDWGDDMSVIKTLLNNQHIIKNTRCAPLPGEYFPNGYRLKNNMYDKENFKIAHASYALEIDDKIKLLKSCDCWIENAEKIISK